MTLISQGIKEEKAKVQAEIDKEEANFNEKIAEMASKRKSVTLTEPEKLQELRIRMEKLKEDSREVENEINVRKNRSREFFLGGIILGGLILLAGIILVFKR